MNDRELRARVLVAKSTGDPVKVAHALCDLAACQNGLGDWEDAHESLNDADFVLLNLPPGPAHVRVLRERAEIFQASGLTDFASNFFGQATALEATL